MSDTNPTALELADALERDKWHVSAVTMQRAADMLRELSTQAEQQAGTITLTHAQLEAERAVGYREGAEAERKRQAARSESPAGWRLVPIEPTAAMNLAGAFAPQQRTSEAVYRAMLSASPHPEAQSANDCIDCLSDGYIKCVCGTGPTWNQAQPTEQRKPLTEAQQTSLWKKASGEWMTDEADFKAGIRAAERAHGITEE